MAITNHERVGKAMELLKVGWPFRRARVQERLQRQSLVPRPARYLGRRPPVGQESRSANGTRRHC